MNIPPPSAPAGSPSASPRSSPAPSCSPQRGPSRPWCWRRCSSRPATCGVTRTRRTSGLLRHREAATGDACGGQRASPTVLVLSMPGRHRRGDGTKPHRGCPGRCSLRRMLLGLAELGDRDGQGSQVRGERDGDQRGVSGDLAGHCDQPRGGAQLVPRAGGRRYVPVAGTGGAVVAVSGPLQVRAIQRLRRGMQNISRRPGRVRGLGRVVASGVADVFGRGSGLTGRVPKIAFCSAAVNRNAPERSGAFRGASQPRRSRGKVSPAASRPPPYHTGTPSGPSWPVWATAYPVTWPGEA
jgi:hypothetical protein